MLEHFSCEFGAAPRLLFSSMQNVGQVKAELNFIILFYLINIDAVNPPFSILPTELQLVTF